MGLFLLEIYNHRFFMGNGYTTRFIAEGFTPEIHEISYNDGIIHVKRIDV